ncbi:MAG TPA: glycosyltransferase family 4 protein [Puia sp.]|nr:glycosyltransferase family 4 protein [Puia sp.]
MRVLIIHNRYQQLGGEDTVVEQESNLLSETENVSVLIFQNLRGWKGALQFLFSLWNFSAAAKVRKAIHEFKPAVIHLHNWHYAIGPIVIRTAKKNNIPIILTIHNYRLLCPSGILLHDGSLFLESVKASFPWSAVRKKVYRNSTAQTFWLAFIVWFHKRIGTWKLVDKYILLTDSVKDIFISSSLGINASQLVVKPNFLRDSNLLMKERKGFFLYVGRLSEEKGVNVLLDAFKNTDKELYIAGEGPLKEKVVRASNENPKIHYLGLLNREAVQEMIAQCSALIFPSIWYEGMPMTLIEAFAAGTPVIASNIGAMSSMIRNGYNGIHFTTNDPIDLYKKTNDWINLDASDKKQFYQNARSVFEDLYTSEKNKKQLLFIYESVRK